MNKCEPLPLDRHPPDAAQVTAEDVVACLRQLPALPAAVAEILASFAGEDTDVGRLADLIAHDQGLAARVLRVANSSFFGLQHQVGTIHDAIIVLGFSAVGSLVLAVGANGVFHSNQCPGFEAAVRLRHEIGVGLAARTLAPLAGQRPDLAFAAGILHDIGELFLAANFPQPYQAVLAYRHQHHALTTTAEAAVLGITHAEVGALLAETWRFPPALRDAIADHHAPAAAAADSLANLVHVADVTAQAFGLSRFPDEPAAPLDGAAWERLGIACGTYTRLLPQIEAEFETTWQAFRA